jgi:hypothetical protein
MGGSLKTSTANGEQVMLYYQFEADLPGKRRATVYAPTIARAVREVASIQGFAVGDILKIELCRPAVPRDYRVGKVVRHAK